MPHISASGWILLTHLQSSTGRPTDDDAKILPKREGHSVERIYLRQRSSDGSVNKTILKPCRQYVYVGFSQRKIPRSSAAHWQPICKTAKFRSLSDKNGLKYRHSFSLYGSPIILVLPASKHLHEIPTESPPVGALNIGGI